MDLAKQLIANAAVSTSGPKYQTVITGGKHGLIADEPADKGGADSGPDPYQLLLGSLGSCTAITLRMYADRKMWVIEQIKVSLEMFKVAGGTMITRNIVLEGNLTAEQKKRLIQIADVCPVHKILVGNVIIETIVH